MERIGEGERTYNPVSDAASKRGMREQNEKSERGKGGGEVEYLTSEGNVVLGLK